MRFADSPRAWCDGVMWRRRVTLAALVTLVAAVAAAGALAAPSVTGVRIGEHLDKTRFVLDLSEPARFRVFALTGPDRIVIDLPPVRWTLAERTLVIDRAGVAQVRFGHFSPETSRLVIDLARPVTVQKTYVLVPSKGGSPTHRLIVDFGPRAVSARRAVVRPAEATTTERKAATAAPQEPAVRASTAPAAEPTTLAIKQEAVASAPEPAAPARQKAKAAPAAPQEPAVRASMAPAAEPTALAIQEKTAASAPEPAAPARQKAKAAPAAPQEPAAQAKAAPASQPAAPAIQGRVAASAPEPAAAVRQGAKAAPVPRQEPAAPIVEVRLTPPTKPVPPPRAKPVAKPVRYLVALDPGHGGRDPGAMTAHGANEKTITLTFARELRAALESSGKYRVVMTRNRDRKVGLHRRVDIARDAGADIFLSIHVDRLDDRRVRGASVYTLSDDASDEEAAELAARENKADVVVDVDLSEGYDEDVAKVLISLIQQNTMDCSAAFANLLVPALGRVAPLIKRPHRFADFRVLKAPDIPSVLVELGFLSNDQDAARLRSRSHRAVLAGAITRALDDYFREPC